MSISPYSEFHRKEAIKKAEQFFKNYKPKKMNKSPFTKTDKDLPETGCECLCIIQDDMGNQWYGTRQFDGYFRAFCVEEDEAIVAWMQLERIELALERLT